MAFESSYPVGVPHPLHIHHDAIESFYVLEGTCRFYVGGEVITATQGSFVSIPRGVDRTISPGTLGVTRDRHVLRPA